MTSWFLGPCANQCAKPWGVEVETFAEDTNGADDSRMAIVDHLTAQGQSKDSGNLRK